MPYFESIPELFTVFLLLHKNERTDIMNRAQFQVYLDASPGAKLRDIVSQMLYDDIVSLHIAPGTKLNVNRSRYLA